jgi:UDPglucose 6-dehydrogenase
VKVFGKQSTGWGTRTSKLVTKDRVDLKVSVIGLGVGYALACCLAEADYQTVGIDADPKVVANPRSDASVGRLLARKGVKKRIQQNLKLTTDYSTIKGSRFVIICVSTGDEKKLVLGQVEHTVRQTIQMLRNEKGRTMPIVMVYSTLPFGSSKKLREVFREEGVELDRQIGYVHFPLMIAQGTTAEDFVNPPFVVFGSYDPSNAKRAMNFYGQFTKRSELYSGSPPPIFLTTPEKAELAKLCANAYLTTKMALANEIGSLCEQLNLNGQKIMEIVGADWRIGRKFTRPGYAIGGQCFPRDLKSLIETFRDSHVEPQILVSVNNSNEARVLDPLDKIEGRKILVLGTSYKEGVKDERGSQVHKLIADLRTRGYSVRTFDPKTSLGRDMSHQLKRNDTIIVTIPESNFRGIGKSLDGQTKVVLDYANIVDRNLIPRQVRLWTAGHGWFSRERYPLKQNAPI